MRGILLGAADHRFAECFHDGRAEDQVVHDLRPMVGQRVFGIALGYEEINDHDELRHDPVLAGKLTLNRLEHAPVDGPGRYHKIGHDGEAIEDLFVDLFLEAHKTPPKPIVLDLDATDDPVHGSQEGRFHHGCYK